MDQGFVQALIGFDQTHVLTHNGDDDLTLRVSRLLDDIVPDRQVRCARPHAKVLYDLLVQSFLVICKRDLVDAVHIPCSDHRLGRHVTKKGYFILDILIQCPVRTTQQYVRLDTDLSQFLHRVLGGFCLELSRRFYIRHQCKVDVDHVIPSDIGLELPDGL